MIWGIVIGVTKVDSRRLDHSSYGSIPATLNFGDCYRVIKGDARSLDYSSCGRRARISANHVFLD